MKVVILAGGLGTRISEESHLKPKPMIEIGEKPILWHIMKEYSHYGYDDFIICCGYKQHIIKQWFADYYLYNSDVTFNFAEENSMLVHNTETENWKVTVVDTGLYTLTAGRLKRVQKYIGDEAFMMTYGDGVSNINIRELVAYHKSRSFPVTVTAALVEQRFGILGIGKDDAITCFREKAQEDAARVNAGYMVLEPEVFDYIPEEDVFFEKEPLNRLAEEGKLGAYRFDGFWHPMDTMRDKEKLEKMWSENRAPWKVW